MNPTEFECQWCGQSFKKKGLLGRHYDLWVYAVSPRPPDRRHMAEAVKEMRTIREQVKQKLRAGTPVGESSPDHKKVVGCLRLIKPFFCTYDVTNENGTKVIRLLSGRYGRCKIGQAISAT